MLNIKIFIAMKPIGKDKISNDFLKQYFVGSKNVFGLAPHR